MDLQAKRPGTFGRTSRMLGGFCWWLVIVLAAVWGALALWLTLAPPAYRTGAVALYLLGMLVPPLILRPRRRGAAVAVLLLAGVIFWFFSLTPSNDRNWQNDLAVLPWADIAGESVSLHNIRNCDYRSETDFTCEYYDRVIDLRTLQNVDLFLVYWGSPYIAHTMLSFGFGPGARVCFSIETRKEKGEEYSAVKGFFRQYEKIYVMADERDVVRLRTNFRHEDVYLYHLKADPHMARMVFLDYLGEINRLRERPEWYNALTANCTTSIRQHTKPYNPDARFDWRLIINGSIDKMIYERGVMSQELSFEALKEASHINNKAQAADRAADFSERTRAGLPKISG